MKKAFALFALALLIISAAPVAFADENTDAVVEKNSIREALKNAREELQAERKSLREALKNERAEIKEVKKVDYEEFQASREELRKQAQAKVAELKQKREEVRAQIAQEKVEFKEQLAKMRENLKELKETRRALHTELKEKREEIKAEREQKREALKSIKEKLKECAGQKTEECRNVRAQARQNAKEFLDKSAKHIIALLQKARERIENSILDDELKARLISGIDAQLAEVDAAQQAIEALGDEATREDLREAAKTIREVWHNAQRALKHAIGRVASNRIGGVIEKLEHLSVRFDRAIEHLKNQGKDTGSIEAKKAEFAGKLDQAKALHEEAKKLFESGDAPGAAEKIRQAHALLKEAHELLKAMVQEVRTAGASKALESASSEEAGTTPAASDTAGSPTSTATPQTAGSA